MALPYRWTVKNEATRTKKLTKFGSLKYVYPAELMRELRTFDAAGELGEVSGVGWAFRTERISA